MNDDAVSGGVVRHDPSPWAPPGDAASPQATPHPASGATAAATDAWVASVPELPALSGPARTAERLLLLVHYGIDWSGSWVGRYRSSYWTEVLPSRVLKATYRSSTLSAWWSQVSDDLGSAPRTAAERHESVVLQGEPPMPVLAVLREQTPALLLRVRLVADAVRHQRTCRAPSPSTPQPTTTRPTTPNPSGSGLSTPVTARGPVGENR